MEGCCGRKPLLVVKRKQTLLWHLMIVERLLLIQKVLLSMMAVMEESSLEYCVVVSYICASTSPSLRLVNTLVVEAICLHELPALVVPTQ